MSVFCTSSSQRTSGPQDPLIKQYLLDRSAICIFEFITSSIQSIYFKTRECTAWIFKRINNSTIPFFALECVLLPFQTVLKVRIIVMVSYCDHINGFCFILKFKWFFLQWDFYRSLGCSNNRIHNRYFVSFILWTRILSLHSCPSLLHLHLYFF